MQPAVLQSQSSKPSVCGGREAAHSNIFHPLNKCAQSGNKRCLTEEHSSSLKISQTIPNRVNEQKSGQVNADPPLPSLVWKKPVTSI